MKNYFKNIYFYYIIFKIIMFSPEILPDTSSSVCCKKTRLCIETDNIRGYTHYPFPLPKWLVGSRRFFQSVFNNKVLHRAHAGEKCQIIVGETGVRNCCFNKNHLRTQNLATSPSKFHLRSIHTEYPW